MTEAKQSQELPAANPLIHHQLGFNALQGTGETDSIVNQEVTVPLGWTTLVHGTDTERWQLGEPTKTITGMGLSAITAEEVARNKLTRERLIAEGIGTASSYDTTASYARSRKSGANPVEVRVLFYRQDMSPRYGEAPDVSHIKTALDPDTSKLISLYHQARHPVVPRGETIIRLAGGVDEQSGRQVEYFVPKRVAGDYLEAVARQQAETRVRSDRETTSQP